MSADEDRKAIVLTTLDFLCDVFHRRPVTAVVNGESGLCAYHSEEAQRVVAKQALEQFWQAALAWAALDQSGDSKDTHGPNAA